MATRVEQTPGLSQTPEDFIIRSLRSKAGKKSQDTNFYGLKRSNALSDVSDRGRALNNVLEKINRGDGEERSLYDKPYNSSDWLITREFTAENIDSEYLTPLLGVSSSEGVVSLNPRIRIQDRISQVDSFAGIDSFPGLHSGLDAKFYRAQGRQQIGFIKFDLDPVTGEVTPLELVEPDKVTELTESGILGESSKVIVSVEDYELENGKVSNISGVGIYLEISSPGNWIVSEGLENIAALQEILTPPRFQDLFFRITRDYSSLNPPPWFSSSPSETVADLSPALIKEPPGLPVVFKGYWYSRSYVLERWTADEIQDMQFDEKAVVQDSNMRWESLPKPLRSQRSNWGIRWDGYLYITPGIYAFELQTNCLVKIDLYLDEWRNVVDTRSSPETGGRYYSASTFDVEDLDDKFKYYFSETEWEGYVPITIRLYLGGEDKVDPNLFPPSEPDIFIKTSRVDSQLNFYSGTFDIELLDSDGDWQIVSDSLDDILNIVLDENASVLFELTEKNGEVLSLPILVSINEDGVIVSGGLEEAEYTLSVYVAVPPEYLENRAPLWKGRMASPPRNQTDYASLSSGEYYPGQEKTSFDLRPEWWKVSEGHPYDRSLPASPTNTPLDGLATNVFSPELKSYVNGLGFYGDGLGEFSSRPSIILGESRYGTEYELGSNYAGLVLKADRFGRGGLIVFDSFPVNNSTYSSNLLLGETDLGGDPNHKTYYFDKSEYEIAQVYLWTSGDEEYQGKYYLHPNVSAITESDNPVDYGLPEFSSEEWLSPIFISAVQVCDNADFNDSSVKDFVAALSISLEKVTISGYDIIAFSVSLPSILAGGSEVSQFSGKFIKFYTKDNIAFQFGLIDTGEALCFSDALKITYNSEDELIFSQSEVPQPPLDRVSPFGFDSQSGICYPPYTIADPVLSEIAINDEDLYDSEPGQYDVFWGDVTKPGLGGKTLTVLNGIEFTGNDVIEPLSGPTLPIGPQSYTHKILVPLPVDEGFDEDVLVHIGNNEPVKDFYYLYVRK